MMENASLFVAGVDGIDAVFTGHQHLVFPGPKNFDGIKGADLDKGTLMGKPAVMAGFWGSHMGLIDLLLEKDGNELEDRLLHLRGAPDLAPRRQEEGRSPMSPTRRKWSKRQDRPRGDARLRPPPGRQDLRAALLLLLARRRRSVGADRHDAQTWYIKEMLKGTAVGESAAALGRRAVQGRRTHGAGLLHRRPGRRRRDQERRRPLSLSQHRPGRGNHRRAGEELARDVGRHLQPGQAGRQGCRTPEPELSHLQFRRHRRRDLQDRLVPAAPLRRRRQAGERPMPTASST